jgi:hypothetical protein
VTVYSAKPFFAYMAITDASQTALARAKAAKKHEEEEEFDNEIVLMDDVTLISNDGYQFVVEKRTAMISKTIRNIMYGAGNFEELQTKQIRLPVRAIVLERIIQYWHYRSQYSDHIDQLPTFDIDPKMAIELLQAADYLQS